LEDELQSVDWIALQFNLDPVAESDDGLGQRGCANEYGQERLSVWRSFTGWRRSLGHPFGVEGLASQFLLPVVESWSRAANGLAEFLDR